MFFPLLEGGHGQTPGDYLLIDERVGILLLIFGVFAHQHYNKSSHQFTNKLYWVEFGMPILGLLLSFLALQSAFALIATACLVTLIMMIVMVSFNLKRI